MRRILFLLLAAGLLAARSWIQDAVAGVGGPIYRPEIQPLGWSADGERLQSCRRE